MLFSPAHGCFEFERLSRYPEHAKSRRVASRRPLRTEKLLKKDATKLHQENSHLLADWVCKNTSLAFWTHPRWHHVLAKCGFEFWVADCSHVARKKNFMIIYRWGQVIIQYRLVSTSFREQTDILVRTGSFRSWKSFYTTRSCSLEAL